MRTIVNCIVPIDAIIVSLLTRISIGPEWTFSVTGASSLAVDGCYLDMDVFCGERSMQTIFRFDPIPLLSKYGVCKNLRCALFYVSMYKYMIIWGFLARCHKQLYSMVHLINRGNSRTRFQNLLSFLKVINSPIFIPQCRKDSPLTRPRRSRVHNCIILCNTVSKTTQNSRKWVRTYVK